MLILSLIFRNILLLYIVRLPLDVVCIILIIMVDPKKGMTNYSFAKTILVMTQCGTYHHWIFSTSMYGGPVEAQSTAATQSSQSTPPTPKEQPDVAQQFTFNPTSLSPTNIEQ